MPRTESGDYVEPGWCAYCGLPVDRDGDCPNPLCPSMAADPELLLGVPKTNNPPGE
jgi:hypothetical protein